MLPWITVGKFRCAGRKGRGVWELRLHHVPSAWTCYQQEERQHAVRRGIERVPLHQLPKNRDCGLALVLGQPPEQGVGSNQHVPGTEISRRTVLQTSTFGLVRLPPRPSW